MDGPHFGAAPTEGSAGEASAERAALKSSPRTGVTSSGFSSSWQCEHTSSGWASCPQGVVVQDDGRAVFVLEQVPVTQRISATIAG